MLSWRSGVMCIRSTFPSCASARVSHVSILTIVVVVISRTEADVRCYGDVVMVSVSNQRTRTTNNSLVSTNDQVQ